MVTDLWIILLLVFQVIPCVWYIILRRQDHKFFQACREQDGEIFALFFNSVNSFCRMLSEENQQQQVVQATPLEEEDEEDDDEEEDDPPGF